MALIELFSPAAYEEMYNSEGSAWYLTASGIYTLDVARGGRVALVMSSGAVRGAQREFTDQLAPDGEDFIIGFAFRVQDTSTAVDFLRLHRDNGVNVLVLRREESGAVSLTRGDGVPMVTSAGTPMLTLGWHYIELKMAISNSTTPAMIVKVDESEVINATPNVGIYLTDAIRRLELYGWGAVMDLVMMDSTGADLNDFQGDCRVEALKPTAEGTDTGWVLGDGASKTAAVQGWDGDTGYIEVSTASTRQTFTLSDLLVATGTPKAVQVTTMTKSGVSGAPKVAATVRSGGTSVDSATYGQPGTSEFAHFHQKFVLNPVTGLAWTLAELNALEAGVVVLP